MNRFTCAIFAASSLLFPATAMSASLGTSATLDLLDGTGDTLDLNDISFGGFELNDVGSGAVPASNFSLSLSSTGANIILELAANNPITADAGDFEDFFVEFTATAGSGLEFAGARMDLDAVVNGANDLTFVETTIDNVTTPLFPGPPLRTFINGFGVAELDDSATVALTATFFTDLQITAEAFSPPANASATFNKVTITYDVPGALSVIPAPAALPLAASAVGVFALIGWRRRALNRAA